MEKLRHGLMANNCNHSIWDVDVTVSDIQGHPWIHSRLYYMRLYYMRLCLRQKQKKKHENGGIIQI